MIFSSDGSDAELEWSCDGGRGESVEDLMWSEKVGEFHFHQLTHNFINLKLI